MSDSEFDNYTEIKLTPAEKGVMIHCRRVVLIKGTIYGALGCGFAYWLKTNGRGPALLTKSPAMAYGLSFLLPFLVAVGSAQKCALNGLQSLEHSPLAERYKKNLKKALDQKNAQRNNSRNSQLFLQPQQKAESPSIAAGQTLVPHKESMNPSRPHFEPRSPELKQGPTIDSYTYNKDRSMLETRVQDSEQPSAFGRGGKHGSPASYPTYSYDDSSLNTKKGRTFDEIREEHRRRNSAQYGRPSNTETKSSGETKKRRRNKYGDEIEE